MGRPRTGVDNNTEKALTRVICQEVFLASGLTMAQLETVFGLGTSDDLGKKTSKTFSRYCEADPGKSRAASRDTLQRIVRKSLELGWLSREHIASWKVQRVLMLDHQYASEIFEQRKKESDKLVNCLRECREIVRKTYELNSKSQFARVTLAQGDSVVWDIHNWVRDRDEFKCVEVNSEDQPTSSLPEFIAPVDLNGVLKLLDICLEQSSIHFFDGAAVAPAPKLERLVPIISAKKINDDNLSLNPYADIDSLLNDLEKSMK